jgi:polyisoprenoid-binding protein YceI
MRAPEDVSGLERLESSTAAGGADGRVGPTCNSHVTRFTHRVKERTSIVSRIATRRQWKRWLIGGAASVVALVVAGPFVFIHFIEGKAPAPLSLSTQTTTPFASNQARATTTTEVAPVAGSTLDGTWNVATGSTAGYRVKETLFGQSTTAVGRTSTITGSITISGTQVAVGEFSVDMTTVTSGQSQRDGQFQGRIMDTSTYPTATFTLAQPIELGNVPSAGATVTETATGKLTLHGTTKAVTFQVEARRGDTIAVSGSIPIVFSDYGISNPSGGPATTGNTGTLEFLLNFSHS